MATWATVDDVFVYTHVTTSPDQVAQAQGVVEVFSGVNELDTENLSARDLFHLKKAVAYQTAFIASQPEVFSRVALQSLSQDGVSFTLSSSASGQVDQNALVLAPLTKQCISKLSWNRSRSVHVARAPRIRFEEWQDKWLRDEDGCRDWRPL